MKQQDSTARPEDVVTQTTNQHPRWFLDDRVRS